MSRTLRTQVLVVGSGAGGAVTAALLAEAGLDVLIAEEGPDVAPDSVVSNSPEAIARLYRNRGMTPILGSPNLAFVEGSCVGGSTEVNSAFWHRTPLDCYARWTADALLEDFTPAALEPCFERIERDLGVTLPDATALPESSAVIQRAADALGWECAPVPRCVKDPLVDPFAPGAKQSMQRSYVPRARDAGATLLAECKIVELRHQGRGASGARAVLAGEPVEIRADHVFVCCGPIQTPALLRRSGIRKNVGNTLCIHPMLKAAARFDHDLEAHATTLPVVQVTEFKPALTLGGSVFTPGFLAMLLAENWAQNAGVMQHWSQTALYYAATRGLGRGRVRPVPGSGDGVWVHYRLTEADRRALSIGMARLGELLFTAGAEAVYPGIRSLPVLRSVEQCRGLLERSLPAGDLSLSTVHAFSTCPMGENPDLCATDSFGKVRGFSNLYVNDASLIPDSPGVNPQGTTMAIAWRNAEHFLARAPRHSRARGAARPRPQVLVTGAPGWLGTSLVEKLAVAYPEPGAVRCLVAPGADPAGLEACGEAVEPCHGDLRHPESLAAFCEGADGALLYHAAGVIHPSWRARDFQDVNVHGARALFEAARGAGVRRVVAVSSNSPVGASRDPDVVFDEESPLDPFLGYGRSKAALETLVREARARGDFETVVVRAPWFYGPNQPPRQSLFFRMIRTGRFPILGDGNQRRSMTYIDNLCQGLELAANVAAADGRTYWIADARPYTVNEIVETVRQVLEQDFGLPCTAGALHLPGFVGDLAYWGDAGLQALGLYQQKLHVLGEMNRTIACSVERAREELGYEPRVALREGMAESIRWCLARGHAL